MEDGAHDSPQADASPQAGTSPQAGSSGDHDAVTLMWPTDTDIISASGRTKLNLLEQHPMVRVVLQDAIDIVHLDLLFVHAFPNADMANGSVKKALVKAAEARLPATAAILDRLRSDSMYSAKLSRIVSVPYCMIRLLTDLFNSHIVGYQISVSLLRSAAVLWSRLSIRPSNH